MDHERIDKLNLVDRYLMGKLLTEESISFEEHFIDCPQCIAQLQTTKNFMQDLRVVASEYALQIDRHRPSRQFLQPLLRWAMICLLIAAAVGAFFVAGYTQRLRAELNQAESLSRQLEQSYENERQTADTKYQETESQRAALEARLKDEQAQRAKMAAEFDQRVPSEGNLTLFALNTATRGEPDAINQITIPRSSTMVSFSMSLEEELQFENYQITIFDDRNRVVFRIRRSPPDRKLNSLSIFFKPGRFRPGSYSLIVKGIKKEGGSEDVGNYPFTINKTR
ncbi:MAG: hypothetical protein WBV94_31480 [Blastocatellia bacterium]